MNGEVRVYPDAPTLARGVAQHIVTLAIDAIAQEKRFTMALAGGSTPRPAYATLAEARYAGRLDWSRVHLFWGDERCVPSEDPRSNYRMARETLLEAVPIPEENVHRMRGELPPEEAAARYAEVLASCFGPSPVPRFDLMLLGLGEDGHTASLFPGSPALEERERWVVAQYVERLAEWRLTLTLPVLNAAKNVAFVVSGAEKREILAKVWSEAGVQLPAARVRPDAGRLRWFVDVEARGGLV